MLEAQAIQPQTPQPPGDDLAAKQLRALERMRELTLERVEAFGERVQLAREDGKDQTLIELGAAAGHTERSLRQTVLLELHVSQDRAVRIKDRAERRKAIETRKAEIGLRMVDAIDRPEHGRERVERLYVEMDAWLTSHEDDPGLLERPVNDSLERIAADLGLDLNWILERPNSWSEAVAGIKPPHRSAPPPSPPSRPPPAPRHPTDVAAPSRPPPVSSR